MEKVEKVICYESEQLLTDKDITDFMNSSGITLPKEFTRFYKTYNGGYPNANWSSGLELICPLNYFLPIKYGAKTIESILKEIAPENMIPFADNKIDSYYCLYTGDDENYGKIYYLSTLGKYELDLHCNNFNTFINNLAIDGIYGKVRTKAGKLYEDLDAYLEQRKEY